MTFFCRSWRALRKLDLSSKRKKPDPALIRFSGKTWKTPRTKAWLLLHLWPRFCIARSKRAAIRLTRSWTSALSSCRRKSDRKSLGKIRKRLYRGNAITLSPSNSFRSSTAIIPRSLFGGLRLRASSAPVSTTVVFI